MRPTKILICDKDTDGAEAIASALRLAGYSADVVGCPRVMAKTFRAGGYDIVAVAVDAFDGGCPVEEALGVTHPSNVIALHRTPFSLLTWHTPYAAALPRPITPAGFVAALGRVLAQQDARAAA
jgi:hypothetical protein